MAPLRCRRPPLSVAGVSRYDSRNWIVSAGRQLLTVFFSHAVAAAGILPHVRCGLATGRPAAISRLSRLYLPAINS